ncbi:hypothetical protein GF340_05695 [Candidatus Peregrinibacteria bacterium]|nr:hypothetical protein [Candidatus Peregrinibacteria bacterium]
MGNKKAKKETQPLEETKEAENTSEPKKFFSKVSSYFTDASKKLKPIIFKIGYFSIAIVAGATILTVVDLMSDNRVLPVTAIGKVDVGFLPQDEAIEKIEKEKNQFINQPLFFNLDGKTVEIKPEDINLAINSQVSAYRLPKYNFEKDTILTSVFSTFTSRQYSPAYSFDSNKLIALLRQNYNLFESKAENARLYFEGDELIISNEKKGFKIDREALFSDLEKRITNFESKTITIKLIDDIPTVTAKQLEQSKENIEQKINKKIALVTDDLTHSITLKNHLNAVRFKVGSPIYFQTVENTFFPIANAREPETREIEITLSEEELASNLTENIISKLEKPVSPAKIYKNDEGKIIIEGKAEDGVSVPLDKLVQSIELASNQNISTVKIPVYIEKAPLEIDQELKDMGIKEIIATGHSAYYGSPPNRMYNIEFGTNKYNGLLVASGEEFSFNEILGPVDGRSGFLPEKVIKGNEAVTEYGGGICQVSTTLYRAALLAGLPITERAPHSWKVNYYGQSMGHGLDATIYPGVKDVKFLNDTQGHILIQAYTDGPEAYFKIYGTNDGRKTVLDGPYGGGLSYRWSRIVTKGKETVIEEDIWSQYRPIPVPKPASDE